MQPATKAVRPFMGRNWLASGLLPVQLDQLLCIHGRFFCRCFCRLGRFHCIQLPAQPERAGTIGRLCMHDSRQARPASRELAVSSPRPACSFDAMPLPPTASGPRWQHPQDTTHSSRERYPKEALAVQRLGLDVWAAARQAQHELRHLHRRHLLALRLDHKGLHTEAGRGAGARCGMAGAASGVDSGRSIGHGCASSMDGTTKV